MPEKDPSYALPEFFNISLERFHRAFPHWQKYRALGGKHLPYQGGFLQQPEGLLEDVLEIDSIFERMLQQLFKQWREQDKSNG